MLRTLIHKLNKTVLKAFPNLTSKKQRECINELEDILECLNS